MLQGKGCYIWILKNCEGGDMQKAAQVAKDAGLTHVLIKILDGKFAYNLRPYYIGNSLQYADDILKPAVQTFQAAGIKVYGWQYVYFTDPLAEAQQAVARARMLGVDGFIADVEGECKNKPAQTRQYLQVLQTIGMPTALSSYRWPTYHMELDWVDWMQGLDVMMPQVYWMGATNAAYQLQRSAREYAALQSKYGVQDKPYVPTGAAFSEAGWHVEPGQILEFLKAAKELNMPAANFWEWSFARRWAGWWDVIANFDWSPVIEPPAETVPVNQFVIEQVYPAMQSNWNYTGPAPV